MTEYDFGSCGVRMVRTGVVQLGETVRSIDNKTRGQSMKRLNTAKKKKQKVKGSNQHFWLRV